MKFNNSVILFGLVFVISAANVLFIDSQIPVVLSNKTIIGDNDVVLANEKTLSDKTYLLTINANSFEKPLFTNVIKFNNKSIEKSSIVIGGSITIPIVNGNNSECRIYLVNDYINSEAITDYFNCNNVHTVSLNERGKHILTSKLNHGGAEFEIKSDNNNTFDYDVNDIELDLLIKKPQYFAKINDDNEVIKVIVADDLFISKQKGVWIESNEQTGYPGIGSIFLNSFNKFVSPQPFSTWILNDDGIWNPPVPYPDDGFVYDWNDELIQWVKR